MERRKKLPATKKTYGYVFALVVAIIVASFVLPMVFATAPAANTQIKNAASATYTDANGRSLSATSNEVTTFVQQVGSFTLAQNNAKLATIGAQVVYPHSLTNTGNGTDTFTLSLGNTASNFTHTNEAIYVDANADGIPDNLTPVTSVSLAAGAVYNFVVVGTIPTSATTGTGIITVSATSAAGAAPQTNTDTTTITGNASVQITKSLSKITGTTGTTTTVTLAYTNTGNATATNVVITDALQSGWAFVTGTVHWSSLMSPAITEDAVANGTAPNTIKFNKAGAPSYVITLGQIPANTSGFVTFDVTVTGAPGVYKNFATFDFTDAGGTHSGNRTNDADFTITLAQSAAVTIAAQNSPMANANPGATISFDNLVTNTGTGSDIFNITLSGPANVAYSAYPVGTTFQLLKSDGQTPLVDTNADGIPDTGPMAAGATYHVFLKVTLPNGAVTGSKPYGIDKTATSTATGVTNQGASAVTTDVLTAVNTLSMDLTQNRSVIGPPAAGATEGLGTYVAGSGALAPSPVTINPGSSTTYALYVNNTSTLADTYNLYASTTEFSMVSPNTTNPPLTSGITVTYRLSSGSDCSTLGATVTNSGSVSGTANKLVCAVVTTASTLPAGTYNLYFLSQSPTSGAFDQVHDSIVVNTVHSVTLTPNNIGQVYPGGSVVYSHTVTNGGNANETVVFTSLTETQGSWTAVLYNDVNHNGVLDAGDTVIAPGANLAAPLVPGASVDLLVKIQAVSSAAVGAIDTATLTATYNGSSTTVATDTTTVIAGQLRLVKTQALDAACTVAGQGAFSSNDLTVGAVPGACIIYLITATNEGTANVTSVHINDSTPAFTTYNATAQPATCSQGSLVTPPVDGAAAALDCNVGTMTPGQVVTFRYGVRINP